MASTPIADLSYRNYDGPLEAPTFRWWVVAKMSMRLAIKKKGFWIWSTLSAYWYLILAAIYYFVDTLGQQSPSTGGATNFIFSQTIWKDKFLDAFSISQMLLFIVALLIGIGTIANDNRANALLVYLSKPCSKADYLIGKWVAIFLLLLAVTGVPMLLFYGYCFMSYRQYGFVSQDPALFWKLLLVMPLPAILHASLCLGISSLFNQARLAGATYAALYFLTLSFTKAMQVVMAISWFAEQPEHHRRMAKAVAAEVSRAPQAVQSLFYASVDGLQIGLAKDFLGTNGSPMFPNPGNPPLPHAPNGLVFGLIYVLICVGSMGIAWSRVRAVEVVRG